LYLPLLHMGNLIGILEIGFFGSCTPEQKNFLQDVTELIATTLDVAVSRTEMNDLLKKTQQQSHLLLEQEQELNQSNRRLQTQQEKLKRSNQELKEQKSSLQAEKHKLEELTAML